MSDLYNRVHALLVAVLQVPEAVITKDTIQEDLDSWDSLSHLNLMLTLEEEFDVTLDVDDLAELTSVPAILEFLAANSHDV